MAEPLYDSILGTRLPLGDHLAAVRSILANERTLLAYQRTALTTFVAGASFIKFFDHLALEALGWLLLPISVVTLALGIRRYRHIKRLIVRMESGAEADMS